MLFEEHKLLIFYVASVARMLRPFARNTSGPPTATFGKKGEEPWLM
jgi:hypothetical protein